MFQNFSLYFLKSVLLFYKNTFTLQTLLLTHHTVCLECLKHKILVVMSGNCHYNIPPIIICVIWSGCYFIYVISFCTYIKENVIATVFYVLGINFLFFMTSWAFFVAVFTPNPPVPQEYVLSQEDIELLYGPHRHLHMLTLCENKNVEVVTRTLRGHVR